jgi:hypothetical protein
MPVRRHLVSLLLVVALTGCAAMETARRSTTLQNTFQQAGKGRIAVLFTAVGGVRLQEGVWVPPPETQYKVVPRKTTVAVRVVHDPMTNYLSSNVFESCVSLAASLKANRSYVGEVSLQKNAITLTIKDQASGEAVSEAAEAQLTALDPVKSCALEAAEQQR